MEEASDWYNVDALRATFALMLTLTKALKEDVEDRKPESRSSNDWESLLERDQTMANAREAIAPKKFSIMRSAL
jgi:hypothetical protein